MRRLSDMANIYFIRQKEIVGLGDAIYYARQHTGNEPFAVLLGDTVMTSVIPVTQQLSRFIRTIPIYHYCGRNSTHR